MTKNDRKALKAKLLVAIKKTLQANKAGMTRKTEKAVKRSIKQIVKKAKKKKEILMNTKNKEAGSNSNKKRKNEVAVVLPQKKRIRK